ncbi:hypothetical protein PIIN_08423 [Serendipita indica DSM 11827]|uniref:F-box domain-containing protein n=1 Tax=Serendipita indica (strain DSM 11827) TaxID=1109443 RepID=G4TT27_SERID|nr:hypothetical protein PIIN_08423 [Serendipita indica DSM 11827]
MRNYWAEMRARTKDLLVNVLFSDDSAFLRRRPKWTPDPDVASTLFSIYPDIHTVSINFKPNTRRAHVVSIINSITVPYMRLCLHTDPGHFHSFYLMDIYSPSSPFISLELTNIRLFHYMNANQPALLKSIRIRYFNKSRSNLYHDGFMAHCPYLETLDIEFKSRRLEFSSYLGSKISVQNLKTLIIEYPSATISRFDPSSTAVLPYLTTLIVRSPYPQKHQLITFLEYHPTITHCGLAFDAPRGFHARRPKPPKFITLGEVAQVCPQLTTLNIFPIYNHGSMSVLILNAFSESRKNDKSCLSFFPALLSIRVQCSRFLPLQPFNTLVETCYPTALPDPVSDCSASKLRNFSIWFLSAQISGMGGEWSSSKYLERAEMYLSTEPRIKGWDVCWPY